MLQIARAVDPIHEVKLHVLCLSGRSPLTISRTRLDYLLFDDLDRFLANPNALGALEQFLKARGGFVNPDRTRFVATTTLRRADLIVIARRDLSSSLVTQTTWAELDPWSEDWEALVTRQVSELLGGDGSAGDRWSKAISEITGGHPHLVADAVEELGKLSREERHTLSKGSEEMLEQFLRVRLATGGGFSQICRALEELTVEDKAFLRTVASGGAKLSGTDSSRVARVLSSDLVYVHSEDKDLRLRVVPGMVSDQARAVPKPVGGFELRHLPDQQEPKERGIVELIEGDHAVVSVSLAGTAWKILSAVFDARGEVVPRARLKEVTELPNKVALNSALQRLRATLRAAGIEHALESVRNEGYRKRSSPLVGPRIQRTSS